MSDIIKNVLVKFGSDDSGLRAGAATSDKAVAGVQKTAANAAKSAKDLKTELGGVVRENFNLRDAINRTFGQFGQVINGLVGSFSRVTTAIIAKSKALGVLRAAIISTGIGAFVVALGSLAAALFTTERGLDAISSILTPIRATLDATLGVLQRTGQGIIDAFRNPKKFVDDMWRSLSGVRDVLGGIVTFDAGRIKSGLKSIGDSFSNAGKQVSGFFTDAVKKGNEIFAINEKIEELESTRRLRQAQISIEIDKQQLLARSQKISEEGRKAAIAQILDLTKKEADIDIEIVDLKIKKLRLEQSLNDTKVQGAGSLQELNELEAERLLLQNTVLQRQREFIRITNGFDKQKKEVSEILGLEKLKADLTEATKKLEAIDTIGTQAWINQAREVTRLTTEVKGWESAIESALSRLTSPDDLSPLQPLLQRVREVAVIQETDKFVLPEPTVLELPDKNEQIVVKFEEQAVRIKDAAQNALSAINDLYSAQIDQTDRAITLQEKRIDRFTKLAETGSARQLIIEEERLQKLEEMRERAVNKQRKIAQAQTLIDQATTISASIAAIANAFGTGGPAGIALGVATAAALALSIAGMIATAKSSFGEVPAFASGTEFVKGRGTKRSDSVNSRLSVGERVVDADTNTRIRWAAGGKFPNAQLPEAVSAWMGMPGIHMALYGLGSSMDKGLSEIKDELAALREENRRTKINFLAGKEGISAMITQHEINRRWLRA